VRHVVETTAISGSFGESSVAFRSRIWAGLVIYGCSTKRSTRKPVVQLVNSLELVYAVWRAGWSFQRTKQIGSERPLWVISGPNPSF